MDRFAAQSRPPMWEPTVVPDAHPDQQAPGIDWPAVLIGALAAGHVLALGIALGLALP